MAQLTDDCFAFDGPLLPLEEMEKLIVERVQPVAETELVPLLNARLRVTTRDILAPDSLPPFDNSAVDGYAVRHSDLNSNGDTVLPVKARLQAGHKSDVKIHQGEAIRIFTGAPMPGGADTVFMQEDVTVDGDKVTVPAGLKKGANTRLAGEDIRQGAVMLKAGTVLEAQHIALAAALGLTHIEVRRRLKVAIFSTGDEVVEPGGARPAAAIFDANRYLLAELFARAGVDVTDLGILPDKPEPIASAISAAAKTHDLVVTSGGVSTGEADYVKDAVSRIGALVFWRIGIKPGRPVTMGVVQGAAFMGLPGNPVAVFVTFVRVVMPLVRRLAGARLKSLMPLPVRVSFPYKKKSGRREYVRVSLRRASDGELDAIKYPQDGAGVLTSLTETDGLLEFPEDVTKAEPGDRVGFLSYATLLG
ncbi:MAG: molybdopterin molybdotransferase MoeA [Pseudolabrys sp.]|nr:molybdopterin molybdotransferase MoeA [Pseudolabrys sp.]